VLSSHAVEISLEYDYEMNIVLCKLVTNTTIPSINLRFTLSTNNKHVEIIDNSCPGAINFTNDNNNGYYLVNTSWISETTTCALNGSTIYAVGDISSSIFIVALVIGMFVPLLILVISNVVIMILIYKKKVSYQYCTYYYCMCW